MERERERNRGKEKEGEREKERKIGEQPLNLQQTGAREVDSAGLAESDSEGLVIRNNCSHSNKGQHKHTHRAMIVDTSHEGKTFRNSHSLVCIQRHIHKTRQQTT